jgi:hypothetical protein
VSSDFIVWTTFPNATALQNFSEYEAIPFSLGRAEIPILRNLEEEWTP